MTEQVLTDDEKNALLDGVSSGAVQVHASGGPRYASVRAFDVNARSRMVTNSFPRLQATNQLFAEKMATQAAALLQCDLEISSTGIDVRTWGDCCLRMTEPAITFLFAAAPLTGNALVVLDSRLVSHLVELFFGSEAGGGRTPGNGAFTPGERSVANVFCDLLLTTLRDAWRPLIEFAPERGESVKELEFADIARDADAIIASGFELSLAGHHGAFRILWPREMVASLLPAFEGRKREGNAAVDARWEQAIRRRLAGAPISVAACTGAARHALGDLAALVPGDVLPIGDPRSARIVAGRVEVMNGRFGVFEGRNAVEANTWLQRETRKTSVKRKPENGE